MRAHRALIFRPAESDHTQRAPIFRNDYSAQMCYRNGDVVVVVRQERTRAKCVQKGLSVFRNHKFVYLLVT